LKKSFNCPKKRINEKIRHPVKIVGVECGFEGDDDEEEGREHGGRVQQLQLLLALLPEQSVDQSTWDQCYMGIQFLSKHHHSISDES
jgi:hypothetical protein